MAMKRDRVVDVVLTVIGLGLAAQPWLKTEWYRFTVTGGELAGAWTCVGTGNCTPPTRVTICAGKCDNSGLSVVPEQTLELQDETGYSVGRYDPEGATLLNTPPPEKNLPPIKGYLHNDNTIIDWKNNTAWVKSASPWWSPVLYGMGAGCLFTIVGIRLWRALQRRTGGPPKPLPRTTAGDGRDDARGGKQGPLGLLVMPCSVVLVAKRAVQGAVLGALTVKQNAPCKRCKGH